MGKSTKKAAKQRKEQPQMQTQVKDLQLDNRGDGLYSGTFRWLETKQFPSLPAFPSNNNAQQHGSAVQLDNSWDGYLRTRGAGSSTDLVATAMADPSCLDALSFPLSFVHVATVLGLMPQQNNDSSHEITRHIVIIGASTKAEQRVWRTTEYWNEIAHFFPDTQLVLWFTGPEVTTRCQMKTGLPNNLQVRHVQATFGEFYRSSAAEVLNSDNTVVIGFNTGFGNFVETQHHGLLFSWLPDLYLLAESNFPVIFTCANDYADMNGEFAVQSRVVGAKMLLLPQQNPFSAASHLHEDGKRDTAWSRGNSFLYAIQGFDPHRRVVIRDGDVATLHRRLDEPLDLHLVDRIGRHFIKGMVLSKEQASRCKGTKNYEPETAAPLLETPTFDITTGALDKEMLVLVRVPKLQSTAEPIAVDVSSESVLSLLVANKYALQTKLPFEVDQKAAIRADLVTKCVVVPILRIRCMRQ